VLEAANSKRGSYSAPVLEKLPIANTINPNAQNDITKHSYNFALILTPRSLRKQVSHSTLSAGYLPKTPPALTPISPSLQV